MQSASPLDLIKSQLSLKNGLNKTHSAILLLFIIFLFFLFSNEKPTKTLIRPHTVTQAVLKAIYDQNIDKKLEYAESKPIILSLEKYLHAFETFLQSNPVKAGANLIIIKRRLLYLKKKDLEVSQAERILYDVMEAASKKQVP